MSEATEGLPSSGLLSFYDRLRGRIAGALERRGGGSIASALMLVPDVFLLLARMSLDPEVPRRSRALFGGALAYFILPADLLPELALGPVGYLDDLVLAAAVLSEAFDTDLEELVERHWSGTAGVRKTLTDVVRSAEALLGDGLWKRIKSLLERRGVVLEES